MSEHKDLSPGSRHGVANWEVASIAQRDALTPAYTDVGKICWVLGRGHYTLANTTPITWEPVSPGLLDAVSYKFATFTALETWAAGAGGNADALNKMLYVQDTKTFYYTTAVSPSVVIVYLGETPSVRNVFADAAAKTAFTPTIADLGKFGYVSTTGRLYYLTAYTPSAVWVEIGSAVAIEKADAAQAAAIASSAASLTAGLVAVIKDRGSYDASSNAYPTTGGSGTAGAIKQGDLWTISVAGTLPTGVTVYAGDVITAKTDTPGSTQANWGVTLGYRVLTQVSRSSDAVTNSGAVAGVKSFAFGTACSVSAIGTSTDNAIHGGNANVIGNSTSLTWSYCTIGGGNGNTIYGASGHIAGFIGGGASNTITGTTYGAICGGQSNTVNGHHGFIGGGQSNTAGSYGAVGAGANNQATGTYSGVLSGNTNTASGQESGILSGNSNTASGQQAAVVAGKYCTASAYQQVVLTGEYAGVATGGGGIQCEQAVMRAARRFTGSSTIVRNVGQSTVLLQGEMTTSVGSPVTIVLCTDGSNIPTYANCPKKVLVSATNTQALATHRIRVFAVSGTNPSDVTYVKEIICGFKAHGGAGLQTFTKLSESVVYTDDNNGGTASGYSVAVCIATTFDNLLRVECTSAATGGGARYVHWCAEVSSLYTSN